MSLNLTFPTARMVQGNLYKLEPKKDQNNQQVIGKDGQPVMVGYFAVAIPKNPGETAWWNTAWGQQVLNQGAADMPNNYQHPTFAWKIEDGDSIVPNKRMRKNADREGFPGNWILKFSSSFLPDICTLLDASRPGKPVRVMQEGFIQCGSYVQVAATIAGNKRTDSPGVYLNPNIVCLVGYGQPISFGMDPEEAGFGASPLPAGASMTPLGGMGTPLGTPATAGAPQPAPIAPANLYPAPGSPPAPVAPVAAPPAVMTPAPVAVAPHPTILAVPQAAPPAPAPVPAPAAPPPASGPTMTALATTTYAEYRKSGWSDEQLRAAGLMV